MAPVSLLFYIISVSYVFLSACFYISLPRPTSTDTYPTSIVFLIFFYPIDKQLCIRQCVFPLYIVWFKMQAILFVKGDIKGKNHGRDKISC